MRCAHDAIDHRIPEIHVRSRHVDLRPQHVGAFLELAVAHAQEEIETLFGRARAVRTVAPRVGEGAAVGADLLRVKAAHVRVA